MLQGNGLIRPDPWRDYGKLVKFREVQMSLQDGISDMLTRVRNACGASHDELSIPMSKMNIAIASVLKTEGYIGDFSQVGEKSSAMILIKLKYYNKQSVIEGLKRISKPSCRIYCGYEDIPKVRNGLGTVILSTPRGVMSGRKAGAEKTGGEIICYVW